MKSKRVISSVLVFCMMFTVMPTSFNNVLAADQTNISDMDALSALGIDSGAPPDGYDENDTSNPYGKDTITVNPIDELYVVGLSNKTSILTSPIKPNETETGTIKRSVEIGDQKLKGKIYGNDIYGKKTAKEIMNNVTETTLASGKTTALGDYYVLDKDNAYLQSDNYSINSSLSSETTGNFSIAASKVVNGNFDGNTEGKTSQSVLLYTGMLHENGGLFMRIGDTVTGEYGSSQVLIPITKSIGNPSDKVVSVRENFATDPYLMQNYLQVTTGDYDGDGTDEIAVFIPEYGGSRIVVYKLKKTTGQTNTAYRDAAQWTVAWTYSLKEADYVSNMVSLVSGDFDENGIIDLGATWGYYYGPENNKGSKAVIMYGGRGSSMLTKAQEFDLTYGNSKIVRASFTFGDLTGSGDEVLILGGQSDSDIAAGKLYTRYVAIYSFDGSKFDINISKNFDLFAKDDKGNYVYPAMSLNKDIFYSSSLCPANLAVLSQGLSESAYLYLDSLLIKYEDEGLNISAALDQSRHNAGNTEYYVEYGVVSGDLVGLGYDTFATMQQTMSSSETIGHTDTTWNWYYRNWFYRLFKIKTWYATTSSTSCSNFIPNKTYMIVMDVKNAYEIKTEVDSSTSMSMQNTDRDTSFLKYRGKDGHYFTYTDPEVLAVLASPPYFSDLLDRDDLSGSYGESTTSYSSTKGSGGGDTFNTTIEVGAYVSIEQEFSVFGIKVASAEAEVAITAGFTYETETTSSLEQTVSYSANAGEDMVAFYSIPLEIYEYDAYTSNGDGTYTKQVMTVNIPHTAAVQLLTLEKYENIAKDYEILPQISGTILNHTVGNPFTYPTRPNGYFNPLYLDEWARVGFSNSGASISQEIAMSSENNSSYEISGKLETKAGAGAGGVTVGVTFGSEIGGGWVYTSTSGNSFSAEMQNMPIEAQDYGYGMNWKLLSYLYNDGQMSFPVVSYLVDGVIAPPSLPTDFEQNVEKTTDSEIAFTWTYDKQVAGFQIYRYYEFPDGSGSYELKFVPMTQGKYNSSDGLYYFEYIDKNLSPYTDYQYQIQTVRASAPNLSIPSQVVVARTKTDVGYPEFTLEGLDQDGILRIYPDSESIVTTTVLNKDDYPAGISYQWQRLENGLWKDIAGKTTNKLTFKSSGTSDQASYRCRANVIYYDEDRGNNYYISAYTDVFNTRYSKRISVVVPNSFIATTYANDTAGTGVAISLELMSANTNHYEAPTGNVVFTVSGTDYKADHTVALSSAIRVDDNGKKISKATLNIPSLPPGVYEVSAYYSGSRVFQSLTTSENVTFLVGSSGYQLILQNNSTPSILYTYGDMITATLKYLENIDGKTNVTTIDSGLDCKIRDRNSSTLILVDDIFKTPNVGNYTLEANFGGQVVAQRDFSVSKKDITVKAVDKTVGKGSVESQPPTFVLSDGEMAFDEKLSDLYLAITATNTAGNPVIVNNDTEPGNYTIIAGTTSSTDATKYNNYNVKYSSGVYTIIGQKYVITMIAEKYNNREAGTIKLSNSYSGVKPEFSSSTELLFYATPYSGYQVDSWKVIVTGSNPEKEIALAPSQFNSTKTTLSYVMNDEPITVSVKFKPAKMTLSTAMEGLGTISCSDAAYVNGTEVTLGAEFEFTAKPADGYNFKEWKIESGGSTTIREGVQNEDGTNRLTFTMGSQTTTIRAIFERDKYTITLSDNLEAVYAYKIGEEDFVETVYSGAKIVGDTHVTVRVKAGYKVTEDSVWKVDGVSIAAPGKDGYKFIMTKNTEVSVETEQVYFDITKTEENGKLSVTINGVEATNLTNIPGGSKVVITANPFHGYAFDSFTIAGTDRYIVNGAVLTINELDANIQVSASFKVKNDYKITINYGNRAKVNYTLYDSFGVEAKRGTVTTGDYIDVVHGDSIALTVVPNTGYMVEKWTIDNIVYDTRSKVYTIDDISKNISILIDIVSQTGYTVNYGVYDGNGSIVSATTDGRSFMSGDKDVGGNSTVIISSAPSSGYMVYKWTINGMDVRNMDNTIFVGKTLVIDSLTSSTTLVDINVYFTPNVEYGVTYEKTNAEIDAEFTPDDAVTSGNIRKGAKAEFTISPEAGYRIVSAEVVESEYTLVKNKDSSTDEYGTWTLTVNAVNNNLTVKAVAKKIHTITIGEVQGGTLSNETTTSFTSKAIEGETVKLYEDADLDNTFVKWIVKDEGDNEITVNGNINIGFSFIMPDSNVDVFALFEEISTVDIDYEVYNVGEIGDGYNGTLSAEISREGVKGYPKVLSETTSPSAINGINRGWSDDYVTWPKSTVTFTANPYSDFKVLKWKIDGVEYTSPLSLPVPTSSINTLILDIEEDTKDTDVLVQFEQIGEKVTYGIDTSNGVHGKIISAINQSTGNEFKSGNTISIDSLLSFDVEPYEGYEVEAWLVNGNVEQYGKDSFEYMATKFEGADISVYLARVPFTVNYGGENGAVTSGEVESGKTVRGDTNVTFMATANPGYKFDSYTIEGTSINTSTSNPLTITITDTTKVTANFVPFANCIVNYRVEGLNGYLVAEKDNNSFVSGGYVAANDTITFTAKPNTNYKVKSWSVDGVQKGSDDTQLSLKVSKYVHEVLVEFERSHYIVNYGAGANGTISADIKDGASLPKDSKIKFTAAPNEGYQVMCWRISGVELPDSKEELIYEINKLSEDSLVTVEFEPIPEYIVTIKISGNGEGTITAFVNDIEKIITNGAITVKNHDKVKLIANPIDEYNKVSWAIANSNDYNINNNVVTLNDVTSDVVATTSFKPAELITVRGDAVKANVTDNSVNGLIYIKAGYGNDMKIINAVGTTVNVTKGMTVEFTAIPSEGYMVKEWIVNNEIAKELSNKLTRLPEANISAKVSFEPIVAVDVPKGENYITTIVEKIPNDLPSPVYDNQIRKNGTVTFTLTPSSGYYFKELNIAGVNCLTTLNSQSGVTENVVKAVKNNNDSYTITVTNITTAFKYNISLAKPVVTITTPVNGSILVTYVNDVMETVVVNSKNTVPRGTELTITAAANDGYKFDSWGDYIKDKSRNPIKIIVPDSEITLSVTFMLASSGGGGGTSVTPPVQPQVPIPQPILFIDVPTDSWYHDSVYYIAEMGLIKGVSENLFAPDNSLTRGMLITILHRLEGQPIKPSHYFSDVDPSSWYANAISWAVETGIAKGMSDSIFAPDASITREQIAVILYNYAKLKNIDVSVFGDVSIFTDFEKISPWALDAVKWAVGSKLINGKGDGVLDPQSTSTRAEVATILHRFIVRIK